MKEWWDIITTEFTKKGTFSQTGLCMCFLELKCPEKGNVCQFLDDLRIKREELSMVGVDIDEKDYHSTIISSVPKVRDGECATKFGGDVHTDLWGLTPVATKGGKKC